MGEPTYITTPNAIISFLLGMVVYFLKRSLDALDRVEAKVQQLEVKIQGILTKDRRKRLADYEEETRGD